MILRAFTRSAFGGSARFFVGTVIAALVLLFLAVYPNSAHFKSLLGLADPFSFPPPLPIEDLNHPIDSLVDNADEQLARLVEAETHSIADAARAYREQRGRHPPPGFELWYDLAREKNVSVIESFFDQIYEDLEPFWSQDPQQLRAFATTWNKVLSVRNGTVHIRTPIQELWLGFWGDMLNVMPQLPDVDMAMVPGDNPRVMVPFARMVEYMEAAEKTRVEHNRIPIHKMRQGFWQYPAISSDIPKEEPIEQMMAFRDEQHFWDHLVSTCRPDQPIYQHPESVPKSAVPPVHSTRYTAGSTKGYVSNMTMSRNVCYNPNMRTLHGYLINPTGRRMFPELKPIFAVTKLTGIGNDILIPPPTHYLEHGSYAAAEHTTPWAKKKAAAVWRGVATGGHHTPANWFGFHRHRMMHTMNGTLQSMVEEELSKSGLKSPSIQQLQALDTDNFDLGMHNFPFPLPHLYGLAAQAYGKLGKWVASLTDAGFVSEHCSDESYFLGQKTCSWTEAYYSLAEFMNMNDMMGYKYLPDVDGHTSSGRFLGFVRSLSVPIKSSIFSEWHDNRLVPWRHFVPMSAEYQEWWGLLQYFLGYKGSRGEKSVKDHDEIGEKIALQGNEWSHHVERRENLLLYFYRVVLEYARICADNRLELGYVADLLQDLENR